MPRVKKRAFIAKECVACGCCVSECPTRALSVYKGLRAVVGTACVGCGKCQRVCPAGVITIEEARDDEKAVV